ncbi:hypothetical protein V8B55DRAFT_1522164 [Mucor lusitanicus]
MSKPKIIGELVIVAYKARHLPEREVIGKQDPFVVFRIGEVIQKTKTDLRGGQHPTWDDQVTLPIPEKKTTVLVQVYDEDGKRQELISECDLDITKVLQEGEEDNWYPLSYKGRSAGEIYLELTFYSARPPPKRQPTRYGMSKKLKPVGGYVPTVPPPSGHVQNRPYPASPQYPPQPSGVVRPAVPPVPVESHSTPTYHGSSPYPPHQQQQQRPPYNYASNMNTPRPYPPPNPTPSISTGSQHAYPPQQQQPYPPANQSSRPVSFGGQPSASFNGNRPSSPPVPGSGGSFGNNSSAPLHAPLLSSSYNPQSNTGRPNYGGGNGGYPANSNNGYPPNSGYPPQNSNAGNRNSYPGYNTSSPYPPQQSTFGFPEPQQFPGGYIPHSDPLGTPFAAHQGTFPPPAHNGYPPPTNGSYPPQQHQGGYPPSGYPPYQ